MFSVAAEVTIQVPALILCKYNLDFYLSGSDLIIWNADKQSFSE